jgi:hypothetical protein
MKSLRLIFAVAILSCLLPRLAIAQSALDDMSAQIESNSAAGQSENSQDLLEQLREAQSAPAAAPSSNTPSQGFVAGDRPNIIETTSNGVGDILDTRRLIDPITGRIDSAVGQVTGSVNGGIDRAIDGIMSPVNGAIDKALGGVNGQIDRAIASVMSPVDEAISNVMDGIDKQITELLDGIFGKAVEDTVGGVVDEATGGLFGDLLGGGSRRTVEQAYNPLSPMSSIVSATSFQSLLPGVTKPYTDSIPFEVGGMGLPDYASITPVIDALVAGENGNPNPIMQGADRFSTNPQGLSASLSSEVERLGSRSIANSTLSKAGQDSMKADLEGATETLDATVKIADESQDLDVTQDVMKNLSAQLAQDSVIRAGQYKQDMLARQQQAADAVVNTEISKLLGEQNRMERAELLGNATVMDTATAGLYLPGEAPRDD